MDTGNYNAIPDNMKLVHWSLMGGLLHLVQRGGDLAGRYYCNGSLFSGFNVPINGLGLT